MGTVNLNFLPSVLAVSGVRAAATVYFGILASDSAGYVSDASWRCTSVFHPDWMLPGQYVA